MKSLNVIHYLFTFALIIGVAILFLRLNNLEEQLSVAKSIQYPFEERNMTIVLTLIGVGFGLFALFTFSGVKELMHAKVEEVNERYNKAKEEYDLHRKKLSKLEKDSLTITSTMMFDFANECFDKGDPKMGTTHLINSAFQYCSQINLVDDDITKERVRKHTHDRLTYTVRMLESLDKKVVFLEDELSELKEKLTLLLPNISLESALLIGRITNLILVEKEVK